MALVAIKGHARTYKAWLQEAANGHKKRQKPMSLWTRIFFGAIFIREPFLFRLYNFLFRLEQILFMNLFCLFCDIFVFDLEHFLLMFPRQEQQQQQSFFWIFKRC